MKSPVIGSRPFGVAAAVVVSLILAASGDAQAADDSADLAALETEEDVPATVLDYFVVDQRAADVFAMIERDTGIRINPTDAVRGRVTRTAIEGPAFEALEGLAETLNLDLFAFGSTIYVSAKSEATLRLVRLDEVTRDRALATLDEAGLDFAPDAVRDAADRTALALTGPPRMLAIAEAIVESIPAVRPPGARPARTVRVIRALEVQLEEVGETSEESG